MCPGPAACQMSPSGQGAGPAPGLRVRRVGCGECRAGSLAMQARGQGTAGLRAQVASRGHEPSARKEVEPVQRHLWSPGHQCSVLQALLRSHMPGASLSTWGNKMGHVYPPALSPVAQATPGHQFLHVPGCLSVSCSGLQCGLGRGCHTTHGPEEGCEAGRQGGRDCPARTRHRSRVVRGSGRFWGNSTSWRFQFPQALPGRQGARPFYGLLSRLL